MFNALFALFSPDPVYPVDLCVLPAPVVRPKYNAPKQEKVSSMFIENEETRTFGFYNDVKNEREGAKPIITGYDVEELQFSTLWPNSPNKRALLGIAKRLWFGCESVEKIAQETKRSASWTEKVCACFGRALLKEMEG